MRRGGLLHLKKKDVSRETSFSNGAPGGARF